MAQKFKNKVFEQVAEELGVEYKLYTLPYHPVSNGSIEGFHAFLKVCISKHVMPQLRVGCFSTFGMCCLQFYTQ